MQPGRPQHTDPAPGHRVTGCSPAAATAAGLLPLFRLSLQPGCCFGAGGLGVGGGRLCVCVTAGMRVCVRWVRVRRRRQEFGLTRYGDRLGPTAHFDTFMWSMVAIYQMVTLVCTPTHTLSLSLHTHSYSHTHTHTHTPWTHEH